jgi:hypothetical protein
MVKSVVWSAFRCHFKSVRMCPSLKIVSQVRWNMPANPWAGRAGVDGHGGSADLNEGVGESHSHLPSVTVPLS